MLDTLFAPYGQGLGRALRSIDRILDRCTHDFSLRSKETISSTLSRMRSRGLIVRSGSKKKAIWHITKGGKKHFRVCTDLNLPSEDGKIRLVIYDIPEEAASQRVWLRNRLLACDYTYLQKSVWLGNRPLPKELRDELKERKIFSYVYVVGLEGAFEGSIKK